MGKTSYGTGHNVAMTWTEIKPAVSNCRTLWLQIWLLVAVQVFVSLMHVHFGWIVVITVHDYFVSTWGCWRRGKKCMFVGVLSCLVSVCMEVQNVYQAVSLGSKLEIHSFLGISSFPLLPVQTPQSGASKWQQLLSAVGSFLSLSV